MTELKKFKRVVLKLSGEALGNGEEKLDPNTLDAIASQIVAIVDKGVKVAVVVCTSPPAIVISSFAFKLAVVACTLPPVKLIF